MGAFEHARWKIFNPAQHPLLHDISAYGYANELLPGISRIGEALDAIVASIYPNYKGTVPTPGDLPGGAAKNDFYVVADDGDGKSAGYVWGVIDTTEQWMKRYDVDWSFDDLLMEAVDRTMPMYMHKYGFQDKDFSGVPLAGNLAGQHLYGSTEANEHLTLHANSGDGEGGRSGYIQLDDATRPTETDAITLGEALYRFLDFYTVEANIDTVNIVTGAITDSTGDISFDDENLSTTGTLASGELTVSADMVIDTGSITSASGTISFDDEDLTTTGDVTATNFITGTLTITDGSITDSDGEIDFATTDIKTTGDVYGDTFNTPVAQILLSAFVAVAPDTNITLQASGTGEIFLNSSVQMYAFTANGTGQVTGSLTVDNVLIDGNLISASDTDGNLELSGNGSGTVLVKSTAIRPEQDFATSLGDVSHRFDTLYLYTGITDTVNTISMTTLLSLRDILVGIGDGDAIFWDNANSKFVASNPDTEVDHTIISNLVSGDSGHTQFAMLAGRAGGQTVQGDTAASGNLVLESTAHVTKGDVMVKDDLVPFTDASYSGGWSGRDLGDATHRFRDLYTAGEAKGLRLENYTSGTIPANSATKIGRLIYVTDTADIQVDTGASWKSLFGGLSVVTVNTTPYTVTNANDIILVDTTSGDITLDLPTAVGISGKIFKIKNTGANVVFVVANGSETLEGLSSQSITDLNGSLECFSDNVNFRRF